METLESETPTTSKPRVRPLQVIMARTDWREAIRGFAVIALGVLCALGAQAWWEGRQERTRERDYLRHMLADTRENYSRLNAAIASDSTTRAALNLLSTVLYRPAPAPALDTIVPLFTGNAFGSSDFRLLTGTLKALLAAGDLRLISNDSLRARFVAYAGSVDHEQAMLSFYLEQAFGDADRFVRAVPFMHRLFSAGPAGIAEDLKNSGTTVEQLRRSTDLAAVLFTLQAANSNRLGHLRRLRDETLDLRGALEAEPVNRTAAR